MRVVLLSSKDLIPFLVALGLSATLRISTLPGSAAEEAEVAPAVEEGGTGAAVVADVLADSVEVLLHVAFPQDLLSRFLGWTFVIGSLSRKSRGSDLIRRFVTIGGGLDLSLAYFLQVDLGQLVVSGDVLDQRP